MSSSAPTPPRPYVTAVGPHILVSPNSPAIVTLPSIDINQNRFEEYATPRDATTFRWSLNLYPHLAYCLTWPLYQGSLLQRLACLRRTIPIDFINTTWELSGRVRYSWWSLEVCLIAVARELLTWVLFPNYRGPPKGLKPCFSAHHLALATAERSSSVRCV